MRILCLIDSLGPGGAQRQLTGLAVGFKEMGHDVSFLIYRNVNFYKSLLFDTFKKNIDYLSSQNGWFAPASEILDYLLKNKRKNTVNLFYINLLDLKWLVERIEKKMKYGR